MTSAMEKSCRWVVPAAGQQDKIKAANIKDTLDPRGFGTTSIHLPAVSVQAKLGARGDGAPSLSAKYLTTTRVKGMLGAGTGPLSAERPRGCPESQTRPCGVEKAEPSNSEATR